MGSGAAGASTVGATVRKHELMGIISDPFGEKEEEILATASGIVVGRTNIPLVNEGEALFHIAKFRGGGETNDPAEELPSLSAADPLKPPGPLGG